jgi:hypothetical protein
MSPVKHVFQGTALALALLLAPATRAEAPISRDTGIGLQIAAQGNRALELIRAELKAAMLATMKPALPRPLKVSARGAASAIAATVRCAK